jgi:hypothetical protein
MFKIIFSLGLLTLLLGALLISSPSILSFIESWGSTYHSTSTVADFNGDGLLDVVVAHARYETESTIWAHTTLWTNQGGGRFAPARIAYHSAAAAGDVDSDGDPDLLAVDQAQLQVLLNQGGAQAGQLGAFNTYGNPVVPPGDHGTLGSVLLGDLDGDGDLDGFVAGCCSMLLEGAQDPLYIPSHAWVWLNDWDPAGWLNRQTLSLKGLGDLRMRSAALGDLDGDGSLDVFTALLPPRLGGQSGPPGLVLLNDGQGNLRDSGQPLGGAQGAAAAVALGDLDRDGDLDALLGTGQETLVWTNQGGVQGGTQGRFERAAQALSSGLARHLFLADLDGNGGLDALIAGERQARLWSNDGEGNFTLRDHPILHFSQRHALALADFNGDGWIDIFAGAYNDSYTVWLNRGDGTFR